MQRNNFLNVKNLVCVNDSRNEIEHEVLKIAKEVRLWCEEKAKQWNFPSCLTGLCAIGSAKLHESLKNAGFSSMIGYNSNHCFVIYKDFVLDVTATQFGEKSPVMIAPRKQWRFHKEERLFSNIIDLKHFQQQTGWVESQRVPEIL